MARRFRGGPYRASAAKRLRSRIAKKEEGQRAGLMGHHYPDTTRPLVPSFLLAGQEIADGAPDDGAGGRCRVERLEVIDAVEHDELRPVAGCLSPGDVAA
jgi:hypothetical protein